MISYLKGTLEALEEDKVVIDVGGIGYGVFMSGQAMGPSAINWQGGKDPYLSECKGRCHAAVWISDEG